jgi:hypothetical protein
VVLIGLFVVARNSVAAISFPREIAILRRGLKFRRLPLDVPLWRRLEIGRAQCECQRKFPKRIAETGINDAGYKL